jgi:ketosteroid isomerase-like protein
MWTYARIERIDPSGIMTRFAGVVSDLMPSSTSVIGRQAMNIDAEVLAVSAAWDAALIANDPAAFASFVSDECVYVGPTGATTMAEIIEWITTGNLAHHTMETIGVPRVAVYGDTVIVTARKTSTGAWDRIAYAADEWISGVYVRQSERWLCVLSQKCPSE